MKKLLLKLDLGDFIELFNSFLAREKPLYLEGDTKIHFGYINELNKIEGIKSPPSVENLDIQIAHLNKKGVLKIYEIYSFIKIINYFIYLKKIVTEGKLGIWFAKIEIPLEITEICGYFDDKGELRKSVDERFESIEASLKEVKEQMNQTLRSIISSSKLTPYLVDSQIHYINNQEALLLRGGFNHVIRGSVVSRSSGGFFYVVPAKLTSLKDRESALLDRKEEIIYYYAKEISTLFSKFVKFLSFINREFDRFDAYHARVAFAKSKDLEFCTPKRDGIIKLVKFAHPALESPKPISIDFKKQTLMVTGVNAGGKTMLLKSILASSLLCKYLLPMKIDAQNSHISTFKEIYAILDDPQNVKNDISTFAGRMSEFSKLFVKKDILIGVDEIELGTDADEAASLFKVIIEKLMQRGAKIVITTHHKRLASLLATNEEVELLAAIYDEKNQIPTFGFLEGTIGKSYAFETALRYGIPVSTVKEAKDIYGEDKEKLNELIQKNIDLELKMKKQSLELDKNLDELKRLKELLKDEREKFVEEFNKKHTRLERDFLNAINEAKEAIKTKDTKEAHRFLNKANDFKKKAKRVKIEPKSEELKVGDRVKYGNSKGEIKSIKKGIASIDCDGIILRVPLNTLKKVGKPPKKMKKVVINKPSNANSSITLDLHGLRAEEAIEKLDKFLSDALINGYDEVLVYHGIGTGKLAYAVRKFLEEYPSLVSFGDAPANMGGYGATLIKL